MSQLLEICIVIPCYNESRYFRTEEYTTFLNEQNNVRLCFVNDGSADDTQFALERLKAKFPAKVDLVSYSKNQGKAHAVREGVLYCLNNFKFESIAYLDADLAVSLQECRSLKRELHSGIVFCFGS